MQATGGYVGHILVLDMTAKIAEVIDADPYEQWGGGHGMGSALFWDYCKDKTVGPFDPGNVVTISSNPFSGTPVPSSSARVEIQGIGVVPRPRMVHPFEHGRARRRHDEGGRLRRDRHHGRGRRPRVGERGQRRGGIPRCQRAVGAGHGADAGAHLGLDEQGYARRRMVRGGRGARRRPDHAETCRHVHRACRRAWRAHGNHHARRRAPCGAERAGRGLGLEEPQGAGVFGHGKHPGGRPCGAHSPAHRVSEEVRLQRGRPHSGNA